MQRRPKNDMNLRDESHLPSEDHDTADLSDLGYEQEVAWDAASGGAVGPTNTSHNYSLNQQSIGNEYTTISQHPGREWSEADEAYHGTDASTFYTTTLPSFTSESLSYSASNSRVMSGAGPSTHYFSPSPPEPLVAGQDDIDLARIPRTAVEMAVGHPLHRIMPETEHLTGEPHDSHPTYMPDTPNKRPWGSFDSVNSGSSKEARQGSAKGSEGARRKTDKARRREERQDAVNRHDEDPPLNTKQAKSKRANRQREAMEHADKLSSTKKASSSRTKER